MTGAQRLLAAALCLKAAMPATTRGESGIVAASLQSDGSRDTSDTEDGKRMKEIGRPAFGSYPTRSPEAMSRHMARGVERLGYDMLRYPKGIGYETFNYSGFILAETDRLRAAAGIANICARDALTTISGHDSLSNFYDSRFILGLGVSRVTLAESFCGHDDGKPVTTMRAYLVAMGSGYVVQGAVIGTLPARP